MTPINISFMLCLFIFRTQVAKDIEIPTCDTICITNSLRSDVDGTYRFKYFNSTLNGAVYYNSANQYYLNPTIYSDNLYFYEIQSHNGRTSSMCAIYNPTSGYIFDPYDCFKGWSTYEDDEWKDDPNQRLANCNDVTVSGNDVRRRVDPYIVVSIVHTLIMCICFPVQMGVQLGKYLMIIHQLPLGVTVHFQMEYPTVE
eukprot:681610_1